MVLKQPCQSQSCSARDRRQPYPNRKRNPAGNGTVFGYGYPDHSEYWSHCDSVYGYAYQPCQCHRNSPGVADSISGWHWHYPASHPYTGAMWLPEYLGRLHRPARGYALRPQPALPCYGCRTPACQLSGQLLRPAHRAVALCASYRPHLPHTHPAYFAVSDLNTNRYAGFHPAHRYGHASSYCHASSCRYGHATSHYSYIGRSMNHPGLKA